MNLSSLKTNNQRKPLRCALYKPFIVCLYVAFILPAKVQAQIKTSLPIIDLLHYKKSIPQIGFEKAHYLTVDDHEINTMPQFLLKSDNALYVFVNGSGRLYQVQSSEDTLVYKRIDSTYFSGYNIGSFPFCYNDSVYTLGGSGFWRINGQLRIYVPKTHEWDIVELNKEIPLLYGDPTDLIWYDVDNKKIYIGKFFQRDQATKSSLTQTGYVYQVKVLDLVKKEWKELGDLSETLKDKATITANITSSPWGQFVMLGEDYAIIDYRHNRILFLNTTKQDELRPLLASANTTQLFYFKDSTFFYGDSKENKLDSIFFSSKDFTTSNDTVYTTDHTPASGNGAVWLLLIPIAVVIPFGIYRIKSKQKKKQDFNKKQEKNTITDSKPVSLQSILEETEFQTLSLIAKNTLKGNVTSIDELNRVLGVSKKTNEHQKKLRSDAILSINSKYALLTGDPDNLIQKRRCTFDKRSFEYFVNFGKISGLEDITSSN